MSPVLLSRRVRRFPSIAVLAALLAFLLPSLAPRGRTETRGRLRLLEARWGRLVEVRDSEGRLVAARKVVGPRAPDVTTNPLTGVATAHLPAVRGTEAFEAAVRALDESPTLLAPCGPDSPPPFPVVPRDAALLLRFDEPLDPASVSAQTIEVRSAGLDPGRLDVEPTLDPLDARVVIVVPAPGASGEDGVLPAAETTLSANLEIRIPTAADAGRGRRKLLRGRSGASVAAEDGSEGADLVLAFRSGGPSAVTGDLNNGFLPSLGPPSIVGAVPASVCSVVPPSPNANSRFQRISLSFSLPGCSFGPELGDMIVQGSAVGLVVHVFPTPSNCPGPGVSAPRVRVELLADDPGGNPIPIASGLAEYRLPFEPEDAGSEGCFLSFVPPPSSPPAGGVDPGSVAKVRFSEAMDLDSVLPFDTFTLTLSDPDPGGPASLPPSAFVVGGVVPSADLREFTVVPSLPIPHVNGASETRHFRIETGLGGVQSLAGVGLAVPGFAVPFTLRPDAATTTTAGFALRFNAINETDAVLGPPDPGGKPDVGGQVVFQPGELRGRPVVRFSKVADIGNPFVGGAPIQFPSPVQTPLTSGGSRLQSVLRHVDLGLSGSDPGEMNLDVEGLHGSPFGGTVAADELPRLRVLLAHSHFFPDETIDVASLLPAFPLSGLSAVKFYPSVLPGAASPLGEIGNPFAFWHWDPALNGGTGGAVGNPPTTVFDVFPYTINPLDLFLVPGTGTAMMPLAPFLATYTWRDTGFPFAHKGGPAGSGVEPARWLQVLGTLPPLLYPSGQIPSVALPLLVEYRSYPPLGPDTSLKVNGLQVALMVNTSAQPNFRVFKTGTPAAPTNPDVGNFPAGAGPELYWGQADFVVRVTRAFTHWFDTGVPVALGSPLYAAPVVEPDVSGLPAGASVLVEFRGASGIAGACATIPFTCDPLTDASKANVYGVYIVGGAPSGFPNQAPTTQVTGVVPPFNPGNPALAEWTPDLAALNGRRFLQMRFSFFNNVLSGEVPRLSSVGVAFVR